MSNQQKNPIIVIACAVFQDLLENLLPEGLASEVTFLDYGLHIAPANLAKTLQATINNIAEPSFIVLGYGLCGNGLNDLRSGVHTLLVPRADDCIAILLGSYKAYRQEFDHNPGTYYLTKGWLKSGSDPLREYEVLIEKYGSKKDLKKRENKDDEDDKKNEDDEGENCLTRHATKFKIDVSVIDCFS